MGDSDELIERARMLLDNATPGPWEARTAPHPDDDKTPAEWLASCLTGEGVLWCVVAPNTTGDGYGYLVPAVTGDGPFSEAHAEFIAAAPGLVSGLLAEVERLRGELLELGGKLPSDRREALVATYAYEAGMQDARGELAARSDTEPTVVCPQCGGVDNGEHGYASCELCDDLGVVATGDTAPGTCPTCGSPDPGVCCVGEVRPHFHGDVGELGDCCLDDFHRSGSVGSGEQ